MKKNITINLFGTLFAIDEDACSLLEQVDGNVLFHVWVFLRVCMCIYK